jgi:hypothetical protein
MRDQLLNSMTCTIICASELNPKPNFATLRRADSDTVVFVASASRSQLVVASLAHLCTPKPRRDAMAPAVPDLPVLGDPGLPIRVMVPPVRIGTCINASPFATKVSRASGRHPRGSRCCLDTRETAKDAPDALQAAASEARSVIRPPAHHVRGRAAKDQKTQPARRRPFLTLHAQVIAFCRLAGLP